MGTCETGPGQVVESRLYGDTPHINVDIYGDTYPCLIDTGSSSTVISESLYNLLRVKRPNLLTLPVRGLLCSGALGRLKQRVKYQSLIQVNIGGSIFDLLFLVIPNLSSDVIIGVDALESWRAVINLEELNMRVKDTDEVDHMISFIREGDCVNIERVRPDESQLERDIFFVECITINDVGIMIHTMCIERTDRPFITELCSERFNNIQTAGMNELANQLEEVNENRVEVPVQINNIVAEDIQEVFREKIEKIQGVNEMTEYY